mmetsp:Transcript_48334/g.109614  ORF Transcript_48334/g.109614 Transcript_48334/m.109614 type:complete len:217 (-) Transcript_48334:1180-1830(-)
MLNRHPILRLTLHPNCDSLVHSRLHQKGVQLAELLGLSLMHHAKLHHGGGQHRDDGSPKYQPAHQQEHIHNALSCASRRYINRPRASPLRDCPVKSCEILILRQRGHAGYPVAVGVGRHVRAESKPRTRGKVADPNDGSQQLNDLEAHLGELGKPLWNNLVRNLPNTGHSHQPHDTKKTSELRQSQKLRAFCPSAGAPDSCQQDPAPVGGHARNIR